MLEILLRLIDHPEVVQRPPAAQRSSRKLDGESGRFEHLDRCLPYARLQTLREVGKGLQKHWDGQFARAVEAAGGSAVRLVTMVADQFGSFRDIARWNGKPVPILKRAQILAVDLAATFSHDRWGKFDDLQALTAFADYKLPQILRALPHFYTVATIALR